MQSIKFKQNKTVKAFTGLTVLALQVLSGNSYKINIATKLKIFEIQRAMV